MLTPIADAFHNSSGSTPQPAISVAVGNIAADEFLKISLTWETGNPTSISFADNLAANSFGQGAKVYDAGDGKGLISAWVLDSVAVPSATITATFAGVSPQFIDITVVRYKKHGGTVAFNEEGVSTIGVATATVNLPTKTWRDVNFAIIKLFGSARTQSNVGPYVAKYGGNSTLVSTSSHLLDCRENRTGPIAATATLSSAQNFIAQCVGFTYSGDFPAPTTIPTWFAGAATGTVVQIPSTTIDQNGLRDIDRAASKWDTNALFTGYSGAAVATKSFQIGAARSVAGASLILNGQGHASGYGNETLAFGPLQAEVPGWFRLRDTTQPWIDNTSVYADGTPAGCHTYNAIYFDGSSTRNRVLFPGRLFRSSDANSDGAARYFDLATANPQVAQPWNALATTGLGFIWSAFDPLTNIVWGCKYPQSGGQVVAYDVANDTSTVYSGKTSIAGFEYFSCIDTSRKTIVILLRSAATVLMFDAANPAADYTTPTIAGTPPTAGTFSGVLYDPIDDRFVVYVGSNTLYFLTNVAGTWTWSSQTFGGAATDSAQAAGTYGRFAYVKQGAMRGYALINSYSSPVFMFRPSSAGTGPTISAPPTSQTVNAGATATFTVTATSSGGALTYQWKKGGIPVGTNSASYSLAANYADQGAQITVDVNDSNGPITSSAATLTVDWNLAGTGPRTLPMLGHGPFGTGPFGEFVAGSAGGSDGAGSAAPAASATAASTPAGVLTSNGTVAAVSSGSTATAVAGSQVFAGAVVSAASATATSAPAGSAATAGTVAAAVSAAALATVAGAQVQAGAVASAASATTASATAGAATVTGVVAAASSSSAASNPAGTVAAAGAAASATSATALAAVVGLQVYSGAAATAASATTASAVAGTQAHVGTVAAATSGTAASALAGAGAGSGSVAAATSATAASAPAGTGAGTGAVAAAASASALSVVAGSQVYAGSVASVASATAASAAAGTASSSGVAASAVSGTAAAAPAGTLVAAGVVAGAGSATAAAAIAGTQVYAGAVTNATSATLASAPTAAGAGTGAPAAAASSTAASAVAGVQVHAGSAVGMASAAAASAPAGVQVHAGVVVPVSSGTALQVAAGAFALQGAVAPSSSATALASAAGVATLGGTLGGAVTQPTLASVQGVQIHTGAVAALSTQPLLSAAGGRTEPLKPGRRAVHLEALHRQADFPKLHRQVSA